MLSESILKNSKPKVLYIASRPPYPKVGGREHMIAQSLNFFQLHFELHAIIFHGYKEVPNINALKNAVNLSSVNYIQMASVQQIFANFLFRRSKSIQENLYYSDMSCIRIKEVVSSIKPDVIVFDMLRVAQFIDCVSDQVVVVDLDDILSDRYLKMLKGNQRYSSLGTFADRVPKFFRFFEEVMRSFILSFEYKKTMYSEAVIAKKASSIILTSPLEARRFNEFFKFEKAVGISQFINVNRPYYVRGENLLFIGNLTTAQNLASLEFIVRDILPHVGFSFVKALLVVGKYDKRAIDIVGKESEKIKLLGFVESLEEVVEDCCVAIMPVPYGTGIKTKILEAMSWGLPVITNSVGAEGLTIKHGVHAFIYESAKDIAECINNLVLDEKLSSYLVKNSIEYLNCNHSYYVLEEKYSDVIYKALQS